MINRTRINSSPSGRSLFGLTSYYLFLPLILSLLGLSSNEATAAGTRAGSIVSNAATVDYTMNGTSDTRTSNISIFTVDDKLSFTLVAADAASVAITPSGRAYMTYRLTNTGNAPHDFTLDTAVTGTASLSPGAGPAFYTDAAGTTPLPKDPNAGGLPFISNLAPDSDSTVYLFITAPPQLSDGQTVNYLVTAEAFQPVNLGRVNPPVKSSAQAAMDGAVNKNAHPMTRYIVLADSHGNGGDLDRDGMYTAIALDGNNNPIGFKARSARVSVVKSATVEDRSGGNQPVNGATIHYALSVSAAGEGTAMGVIITDPIPLNTTYRPGSLKLNGTLLSDGADSDAGDVGNTTLGTVTVKLGELTSATPMVISFDVRIN